MIDKINMNYSFHDFYNDLRDISYKKNLIIDLIWLKENCDRFLGEGYYNKILNYSKDVSIKLLNFDIDHIRNKFIESNIEISESYKVLLNADFDRIDKDDKFNGLLTYKGDDYNYVFIYMIMCLLYDTTCIRTSVETNFILDDKYKCCNLEVSEVSKFISENKFYHSENIKNYDLKRFREIFKPGISIKIGEDYFSKNKKLINLGDIHDKVKKCMEDIDIDFDIDIFYEYVTNHTRHFDVYQYELKILIK